MLKGLRISAARFLIEANEKFIFNRRLKEFYLSVYRQNSIKHVIDVGSNLGQTIDIMLDLNRECRIDGFEPNPELFQRLKKKYAQRHNVRLFPLGISDKSGTRVFHENILHSTSSFEDLNMASERLLKKSKVLGVAPDKTVRQSYEVNITTLSEFLNDNYKNETIDIIKIDTEGHEYSCLEGLFNGSSPGVRFIQLENHNDDMYLRAGSFNDMSQLLARNGFSLKAEIKHGFGDFTEVIFEKQ